MASIGIRDVSKIYNGGVTAVSDVNIDIADGELTFDFETTAEMA